MKRTAVCLTAIVTCWSLIFAPPASADPTGIEYEVLLDGVVVSATLPTVFETEGHLGGVIFDGLPDLVPNDLDPGPPPPFEHGNGLIVTEHVVDHFDGTETITIWIEGQVPDEDFPTPGAPLFANTLFLDEPVIFSIGDLLGGLHWDDPSMGGIVTDIKVLITFPDDVLIDPLFVEVSGAGTPFDPLFIGMELDPADFYLPFGDVDGTPATDLHVSFKVEHFIIPEPSTLLLSTLVLLGLLAYRRRRT